VQMTEDALYDFMLYHTYSKLAGFLVNVLGVTVGLVGIFMRFTGKITLVQLLFYLIAAIIFLAYTPLQIRFRARKLIKTSREYQEPKIYNFSEEGILVTQDQEQKYGWEQVQRVVAAPKTFGFYYGENDALIIPKESFGEQYMPIMKIVTAHVSPDRIRLR